LIVPLWGQGEGYKSANVSRQRRINCYLEPQSDADRSPVTIYGTPGLTLFASLGVNSPRGARTVIARSVTYIVAGSTLYSLNAAGVYTSLGTLNTSAGRVSLSDNGTQLMLVDGLNGYILNMNTNVFAVITDVNFPSGATTVAFLGGYFIVNKPNTGQFWWSNVYDGTTWNGLQFATAEADPDNLLAVYVIHKELLLLGEKTVEVWTLSADTRIFAPVGSAVVEWGLAAVWSIDRFGDDTIYLARNRMGQFHVIRQQGYNVTTVSTPEIEYDLQQRANISGATAYSYLWYGHYFYQINFPDKSYLYDGLAEAWSEVSSGPAGGPYSRHYGEIRFELLTTPYVTDYRNGNIYKVDQTVYTDNGDPICMEVVTKHLFDPSLGYVTVDELQADLEAGVGINTGQGSSPQIMLQTSRDGGHTWGNERWTSMGPIGGYLYRARWLGLGAARDFAFRMRITDPVKRAILNANLRAR